MYLADWIISLMPPHLHYVETHFGGGAVLLARDHHRNWMATNGEKLPAHLRGCSEVVNDINGELANFWRVLKDEDAWLELAKLLELTPLSSVLFEHLRDASDDYAKGVMPDSFGDEIARAWWFFVKYRQSRQGLGKDFATLSRNRTRGGRNEQANAWLSCLEGLPEIHERLKGVVILNADAIKVIKQQDGEHTLFYCDPPYLHKTRSSTGEYGKHEMTEEQHCELLMALNQIKGKSRHQLLRIYGTSFLGAARC